MSSSTSDRAPALAPMAGAQPVSGASTGFLTLTLGSIGVVFGDIGTSPL
jgi:K+ transporter